MSKDETALICMRVADLAEPKAKSYRDHCEVCKHAVWHAYSSPKVDHVFCAQCAKRVIEEDPDPQFIEPTAEQMKEARDYWLRKSRH